MLSLTLLLAALYFALEGAWAAFLICALVLLIMELLLRMKP